MCRIQASVFGESKQINDHVGVGLDCTMGKPHTARGNFCGRFGNVGAKSFDVTLAAQTSIPPVRLHGIEHALRSAGIDITH